MRINCIVGEYMNLIYLLLCLAIVLVTLEIYVVSGFYARSHRLLPLVLGLLALYDFYLIVEQQTGQAGTFDVLKELLLIQLLDVILYYIVDFTKAKVTMWQNVLILVALFLMDIVVFTQVEHPGVYRKHIVAFGIISVLGILYLVVQKAPNRELISNQTRRNNMVLLVVIIIPAVVLILSMLNIIAEDFFLPMAINISCLIIDYLFLTDRLREVDSVLKEEHFQTLDIPAFLFDTELFFLDASKKARELFGEQIREIEQSPQQYELQKQLIEMQNSNGIAHRKVDGRFYRCELQEARYKGKKKGYILTFVDITEQKNEAEMAKEVARQKSDFLANMSHDLRSPLHAIIGSSEIVLSHNENEMSSRTRTMINHIHEAGNNLLDIVNSILDFSKLESGNLKLHPQKYNFKNLIEEQASVGFINLRDKAVKFSVEVENPFPEYLYGDEIRVRQIVQNLISNAVKFTDEGNIRCHFSINIEAEDKVKILYRVEDTGSGMSAEQLNKVFSDYVTYAQNQKKEGTGLGLSIVRKLAQMMSGRAWAESDGVNGSTVCVEFYQQLVREDIQKMQQDGMTLVEPLFIREETEISTQGAWKNEILPNFVYPEARVLIADDMVVNCKIFKELSRPWEFRVDFAKDGLEAISKVQENSYDLIFLDQMMPVMTGTEAADKMNEMGIEIPKILLTANITEAMKESSQAHGFKAFMHKPIDIAQLRTNIEKYMPKELAVEYIEQPDALRASDIGKGEKYLRALSTYIAEMEELYKVLPGYAKNDLGMYRNKVHGIKGVSRQLGKESLAYIAEIMEMAAITENQNFIDKNFGAFISELEYTIQTCKQEEAKLKQQLDFIKEEKGEADLDEISDEELYAIIDELDVALEEYEMSDVDRAIERLNKVILPQNIRDIVDDVIQLYDDMEYDDAREKLRCINR